MTVELTSYDLLQIRSALMWQASALRLGRPSLIDRVDRLIDQQLEQDIA